MFTVKHIAGSNTTLAGEDVRKLVKGRGLIVEFVGPPGGGKTTNCARFLEYFKKHKINAYIFSDIKSHLYGLSLFKRSQIYLTSILLNGSHILSYSLLLMRHGIYSADAIYRYVKLCVFNSVLQRFIAANEVDLLLLDQWIIQGLWSATIFKSRTNQKLYDELARFYFKTDYVLYFDIDEETACDRINLRDAGRSRFDKMNKAKRLSELKYTVPCLSRLFENSACRNKLTFSARNSPDNNAEAFFYQLRYSLPQKS